MIRTAIQLILRPRPPSCGYERETTTGSDGYTTTDSVWKTCGDPNCPQK